MTTPEQAAAKPYRTAHNFKTTLFAEDYLERNCFSAARKMPPIICAGVLQSRFELASTASMGQFLPTVSKKPCAADTLNPKEPRT